MKRIGGLLLAVVLLMMSLPVALGLGFNGWATMWIDEYGTEQGIRGSYPVVQMTLNDAPLESDVPAFLWGERTMIPVRVLAEAMGAEVEWSEETYQVSITMGNRTVVLKIGSAEALVNGEPVTTYDNVPAILITYQGIGRTMVPVRFVTEQLGAQVEWNEKTETAAIFTSSASTGTSCQVTGIETNADAGTIQIKTSDTPTYKVFDMGDRVVVDVLGAALVSGSGGTIEMNGGAVYRVRYAQHDSSLYAAYPNTVRVVLDVPSGVTFQKNMKLEVQDSGLLLTTFLTGDEGFSFTFTTPIQPEKKLIALDAGHGGSDPGAVYGGVNEKDINLAVTKKVEAILRSLGYNILLTRDSDALVTLVERSRMANEAGADVFVSMHSNAAANSPNFTGIYTYYYPGSTKGAKLAQMIQTAVCETTGAVDRKILSGNLSVVRETNMPAALVEMGFMTSAEELKNLTSPEYQDKLAAGIAEGIIRYLNAS